MGSAARRKWRNPSGTRTYFAWRSMRSRCCDPAHAAWANYGGRGIAVCREWQEDYDAFVRDMGECPDGHTLDRIDCDGNYEPENCRWADWKCQANNKRTNHYLTHDGQTLTIAEWADRLGVARSTLSRRVNIYRMTPEQALTGSPMRARRCGTRQGYEKGCRCDECRAAHAARHRMLRAKRQAMIAEAAQ